MSSNELPDFFDVVILGTGVTESMIAAACSRVGKSVLHLDRNPYYGSQISTFTFQALNDYFAAFKAAKEKDIETNDFEISNIDKSISNIVIKSYLSEHAPELISDEQTEELTDESEKPVDDDITPDKESGDAENMSPEEKCNSQCEIINEKSLNETENNLSGNNEATQNTNISQKIGASKMSSSYKSSLAVQAKLKDPQNQHISIEDFLILNRKFNLDLSPNFLFSAGKLVKSIIKANISHYAEFKLVDRILMWRNSKIEEVPCNRSDVFSSTFLTMIEKRTLMKFLNFCLNETEEENIDQEETFQSFLTQKRLSENLQSFIIYSIAMVKPQTKTKEALAATRSFLSSIGHYGKTPFLWPLYGCGEIPQMFCRMSAVFAGLYCLDKIPGAIKLKNENDDFIVNIDDKDIGCKNIVIGNSYLHSKFIDYDKSMTVSKAIIITNKSLASSEQEHLSFLTIPPLSGKIEPVQVIEVGPASAACPTGLFVLYLSTRKMNTAYEDLNEYVKLLVQEYGCSADDQCNKPSVYWLVYFNHTCFCPNTELPKEIFVGTSPCTSLGFSNSVTQAEEIFKSICPDAEFLEKVPNAEDIIWDYDEKKSDEQEDVVKENDDQSVSEKLTETEDISSDAEKKERDVLNDTENTDEGNIANTTLMNKDDELLKQE